MADYYVMFKCVNCQERNLLKGIKGKALPKLAKCCYCECETSTHNCLGRPVDVEDAVLKLGIAGAM